MFANLGTAIKNIEPPKVDREEFKEVKVVKNEEKDWDED